MNHDDDKVLQSALRAVLQQADDDLPELIRHRLTAARQQARRDARLHEARRSRRLQLLGFAGAATAVALVALLWLPLTPRPDDGMPLSALSDAPIVADMPLLLDRDFALLADADVALEDDDALAFYVWVAAAEAQPDAATNGDNPADVGT
ncbi:MAG: hypothetical protein KKC01_13435 [Gammaproteobacteria bacterium]|nr:hypothetical protein [Gammaproteobacteria bacterium]